MSGTLVIAHRGASGYEVENSLAAFRAAASKGADAVELDIHATADGVLVVHHDETIDGRRHIAHCTAREVVRVRLQNGEPVPTLPEALNAVGPLGAFVEVKSLAPQYDDRLLDALARGPNPSGYAVHGFDHRIVRRLGARRPGLRCGVLSSSYLVRPVEAMDDAGATDLWQERHVVDEALTRTVHAAGYRVFVWAVDDADDMRRLLALGVDGICTNFPDVARHAVDAARG